MAVTDLIEQALDNLVKQFANPMDFLRELVQNSIDAGSPRIEVEVVFQEGDGPLGVVEIHVRDFGRGMDEHVIDAQLTRLFSSAKEGDRTAIGKFGIGFTSVFAIRPEAVRVITGKHGEAWEVLFHEDRTFEKRRYDGPASGTTITIFKRLRRGRLSGLVADARHSLVHWCEHAHTPIHFIDSTTPVTSSSPVQTDVFGDFESAVGGDLINKPFELEGAYLQSTHEEEGAIVVIGFTDDVSWSFFSGGLTLLRSTDPSHLGDFQPDFQGLSFKILSPHVGHTLTRDNVIQDSPWFEVMEIAKRAATQLREELLDHLVGLAEKGDHDALSLWYPRLLRDLDRQALDPDRRIFLNPVGEPSSLSDLKARLGLFDDELWMVEADDKELSEALHKADIASIRAHKDTRALLEAALGHHVLDAADAFCICEPLSRDSIEAKHARIIRYAHDLAGRSTLGAFQVGLCDLGPHSRLLFVEGRQFRGLYRVPEQSGLRGIARRQLKRWQTWLGKRWLMVNRSHPHTKMLLSYPDEELAAYALVEALITNDAGFPETTLSNLQRTAERRWVKRGS